MRRLGLLLVLLSMLIVGVLIVRSRWSNAAADLTASDSERPRGGIQWLASWESGRREAERLGLPILLVAAAPHCAGVSGTW